MIHIFKVYLVISILFIVFKNKRIPHYVYDPKTLVKSYAVWNYTRMLTIFKLFVKLELSEWDFKRNPPSLNPFL